MKKILLLLLFITSISFAQTGTTSAGRFRAITPILGTKNDSLVVWNGATKEYRFLPSSLIGGGLTIPTLQQVTEAGAVTDVGISVSDGVNSIDILPNGNININTIETQILPASISLSLNGTQAVINAEAIGIEDGVSGENLTLKKNNLTSAPSPGENTLLRFPATQGGTVNFDLPILPASATRVLPVSVNGNVADSAGNITVSGGGGSGTVTQFNFTNANGVTGAVTNATTTPTLVLSLGAITPTTVTASGNITGTNLSGTNTGDNAVNTLYSGLENSKQDKLLTITQNTNYVLTNNTSAQQIFNITGNTAGELTLQASTTYDFEMFVDLSNLSATSGFFSFSIGGTATYNSLRLRTASTKTVLPSSGEFIGVTLSINPYTLTTASTATVGTIFIKGRINVNAGGTIQPRITLSQGSAANVLQNSYLNIAKL